MKYMQIHGLIHRKRYFDNIKIDELLGEQYNELSARIENWTHECSGWSVQSILWHKHFISEIVKEVHFGNCEGSSYFSVPKELNDSKNGLINIQNEDNEWFWWCVLDIWIL